MESQKFQETIKEAIKNALKELDVEVENVSLEHPLKSEHGDYSSNIAMVIFGSAKLKRKTQKWGSPRELAEEIVREVREVGDIVEKTEVAPPGFINFFLSKKALFGELYFALDTGETYGSSQEGKGKRILVDHSHPNIAKRFGIGHLRSTIIGQAIIKLHRFLGWDVVADNFLGDWGTQFGAILAAIKSTGPVGSSSHPTSSLNASGARWDSLRSRHPSTAGQFVENLTIDDLERYYVEFNKKAKEDPELWEKAKYWFKKLEEGDGEAREIWQQVKEISLVEFKRIWDLLGVEFDYIHAESFFEDKIEVVIEDAQRAEVASWDQGALIVRIPGFETPLLLLKSDEATTYETRDLAAIRFWMKQFSPLERIVYEVGVDQSFHFQQVFAVAQMLGYARKEQLVHVKHGLYRLETGKMRTRAGQTVKLELVLDEAIRRARVLATGHVGSSSRSERAEEWDNEHIARVVGIGAVKYFDLSHHPSTDIVFDWERMFALEGNSALYLQYTHARCQSVIARSGATKQSLVIDKRDCQADARDDIQPEELALLRLFYRFPEVVKEAAYSYSPNILCNFLFDLAQRYNTFYSKYRILDETRELRSFRLALTRAVANTLKTGLGLLGIQAPERM